MTSPPAVAWETPARGVYSRSLRFGEWISGPVTPLFESWLLSTLEERLHATLRAWIGQHAPRPHHVIVNGWYFYSLNWIGPSGLARSLPDILWHVVRSPRRVAGIVPPTVRFSVPVFEREWRDDIQPRYRAAVAAAELAVETRPIVEIPALIDELAEAAGEYFASLVALAGAAYKLEMNLARFYRRHVDGEPGGSHMPLLAGLERPGIPAAHAVASLDWWVPTSSATVATPGATPDHDGLVARRAAAEEAAFARLSASPRRLRAFRALLAETQRLVPIREAQVQEFTIPWPVMRRAVRRIGEHLVASGALVDADDVFFLARAEALAALASGKLEPGVDVVGRRARRADQARLVPPMLVGRGNRMLRWVWEEFMPRQVGAVRSRTAIVSGVPAAPGRATGPVRVILGLEQFAELRPGEVLVAPLTAPAWTPLFTSAAAVVTDVGNAAAHASIIAREYGIPAVVGCGDATTRLRTGMNVTVDGNTGNVEPA